MPDRPLISHIGIAVNDLEAAVSRYEQLLGCKPAHIMEVADQKVRVAMFSPSDNNSLAAGSRIELLAGTNPESPVSRFIEKRGEGLHHTCIFVDNIESMLTQLAAAGFELIDKTPRIGADGHRIAFVHPESAHGVLLELEEWSD